jgi:hypothetical protein
MLLDERAWLRDPAARAAPPTPVPPYRPDPVRAPVAAADPDGADAWEGDDEEMQAAAAEAEPEGDVAAAPLDIERLRAELRTCIDALPATVRMLTGLL